MSAQSGRMVGVDNEEHLSTPILQCFRYRHPWLQLNLGTAFLAAFVVGFFENTIQQIVVLASTTICWIVFSKKPTTKAARKAVPRLSCNQGWR